MEFKTPQGIRIAYRDQGPQTAPAVVFLHGFPFNQSMWDAERSLLSKDFRVITYDHRGHGQSDVAGGQYLIELLVDDLIALLDHLKVQKAILCGLSMGGYVTLRAVERNPERVSALVLCDTRAEADSNEAKVKRAAGVRTVKEKGVPAFAEGFLKAIFAPETFSKNPEAVSKIKKAIEANSAEGIAGTLISLAARTDTTAALPNIKVPTLILVGAKDAITPLAASEALHKGIPGSQMEIIPGAAHMSNLENPAAFQKALTTFLKTL